MAATNYSPIQLYYSTTASAAPAAGNLVSGELAINITDGKLYYKDNAGTVQLLSTSTTANGTANGVLYLNGSKVATSGSVLTFDGTTLVSGSSGTSAKLVLQGGNQTSMAIKSSTGTGGFLIGRGYQSDDANSFFLYDLVSNQNRFYIDTTPNILQYASAHVWNNAANSSEYMRLTSTGLGIGTSSPAYKLDVRGNVAGGNGTIATGLSWDTNGLIGTFTNHSLGIMTNSSVVARFDTSGNLGLGLALSAWASGQVAIEMGGTVGNLAFNSSGATHEGYLYWNSFYNGTNTLYKANGYAAAYGHNNGAHQWFITASGTAGGTVSFTQAMTLDASGRLGIGTTSPGQKLSIAQDGSVNNQYIQIVDTQTSGVTWQIANFATNALGMFGLYNATAGAYRLLLSGDGNLGLGVTPSAWSGNTSHFLEFAKGVSVGGNLAVPAAYLNTNAYSDAGGASWKYVTNGYAHQYLQYNGQHIWFYAPSGTAGSAISWTQAMTLDASGNLGIGTSSPAGPLDVRAANAGGGGGIRLTSTTGTNGVNIKLNNSAGNLYFGIDTSAGGTFGNANAAVLWYDAAQSMVFATNNSKQMTLDSSGNLGLGVTPSAWNSGYKVAEIGKVGSSVFAGISSGNVIVASNAYLNASDAWAYANNGGAAYFAVRNSDRSFVWNISSTGSGTAGNAITFTQAMTLDASGNLVVGDSTANRAGASHGISVNGTSSSVLETNYASARAGNMYSYASGTNIGEVRNLPLIFTTNDTERARIDSSGNLLVGTTAATNLGVITSNVGDGTTAALYLKRSDAASGTCYVNFANAYTNWYSSDRYYVTAGGSGGVYLAAGGTSWTAVSDERKKDIIEPITNAANKVATLRAVIGKYKTDAQDKRRSFLIAQDVQAVLPEAVDVSDPAELGLSYSDTIPLLVAAIQELKAEVDSLKAQLKGA